MSTAAAPSAAPPAASAASSTDSTLPHVPTGNLNYARVLSSGQWQMPPAPSAEDIKWAQEHTPKMSEADLQPPPQHLQQQSETKLPGAVQPHPTASRIQRRSGINPLEGLLGTEDGVALSEDELQQIEDEHTFIYSRTLTCNAPRSLLWRHLMKKIRQPELYTNAKTCKILCEGPDFVFREVLVGPPDCKDLDQCVHIRDKVTWSEEDEEVRFALYEDEVKEGYIDNQIVLDISGQVCLTTSCRWTFHPQASMTSELLQRWKERLRSGLDIGTAKTVRIVEDEAKQIEKDRRRRNSLNSETEHLKTLTLKESAASANEAPGYSAAPAAAVAAPGQPIQVAAKQEQKAQ